MPSRSSSPPTLFAVGVAAATLPSQASDEPRCGVFRLYHEPVDVQLVDQGDPVCSDSRAAQHHFKGRASAIREVPTASEQSDNGAPAP